MIDYEKIVEECERENQRRMRFSDKDCYIESHAKKEVNIVDLYRTFKYFFRQELDYVMDDQFINERMVLKDDFIDRANTLISILDDMQENLDSETRNIPASSWKDIISLNIQKRLALTDQ